jgi:glycosyltransferase involved in cell wall biosynthesis
MSESDERVRRRAALLLEAEPYSSASGVINALLSEELSRLGYECRGEHRRHAVRGDVLIPLATAERLRRLRGAPAVDLYVYCDLALGMCLPSRALARRTLVLFHGLAGEPASWLGNAAIDRCCVLSRYLEQVLTSLLALPDLRERRCLEPRAFHMVSRLVPALPCVEEPEGHPRLGGSNLPEELLRALEGEDVVGHALQPGKLDWQAVGAILLRLNTLAREHGQRRRFRLAVAEQDFALLAHAFASGAPESAAVRALLEQGGLTLEDLLIPVRPLGQAALFQLFRATRFGLAYNVVPESFGFYVLESVFNGCPVYTNGIGNNRYGVPPGHGLLVLESADMAWGDPSAYAQVAARIFEDVARPEAMAAACRRGREYIQRTYTRSAFARSLHECLERLEAPTASPVPFAQLELRLSPLVRLMDEEGRVVSDFEHTQLAPLEQRLVQEVLGRRAGEVLARPAHELELVQGLFSKGVLALGAPAAGAQVPPEVSE